MLSRELMGALSIAIVWVCALLVAGAAWQDLRDVLASWRRARRAVRATVESADDDALASWWVEQRGRALDARVDTIAFHDRAFQSRVHGGVVRVDGVRYRVSGPGEVWPSAAARARAAELEASAFDGAYAQASRAAGCARTVRVSLGPGDEVFILGALAGDAVVPDGAPLVVAGFDPTRQLARHAAAIVAFIVAELAACGLATWVAVTPPHFGPRSIVGAVLCLGFYLGVTPLAVGLRERVRRPSQAYVRGTVQRGAAR